MEEFKNNFLNVVQNNYVNFNGRARRKEFWQYWGVVAVLYFILAIVSIVLGFLGTIGGIISMLLYGVLGLGLLLPNIAVGVRRMHDVNKSGWFLIIPIYNIILAFQEGDKGANQYGEDPKA